MPAARGDQLESSAAHTVARTVVAVKHGAHDCDGAVDLAQESARGADDEQHGRLTMGRRFALERTFLSPATGPDEMTAPPAIVGAVRGGVLREKGVGLWRVGAVPVGSAAF